MCNCEGAKEARPDIYPSHCVRVPPNATTEPADLAQLRGMLLGTMAQIENLERRIEKLESGGY